jgi:hypothetical protein
MASIEPYVEAATRMVVERLDTLRGLTFEQEAALPPSDGADFTVAGQAMTVTTFRYTDPDELQGKVLVVVLAAKPVLLGIGAHHIEHGLLFSPDENVRSATEAELRNSGG